MDKSELILLLGQIAVDAGAAGAPDIEKFWTSVAAKITADTLASRGRPAERRADAPAQVFTLSAQAYHDQLLAQMSKVTDIEQRSKKFELVRLAVSASQQHGGISMEQANMLRRVTNEVEAELNG